MNLDGLITFEIFPERNAYTPERTAQLIERIEDTLAALLTDDAHHTNVKAAIPR